jgi:membrane-associated phospholipid phosphatase
MIIPFRKGNRETFFLVHYRATLLISISLIILSYFFADIPIAKYFESPSLPWKDLWVIVTDLIDPQYNYFTGPLLLFLIRYIFKQKVWGNRMLLVAISVPLTNLLVELLKHWLGRARPELLFSSDLYGFTFSGSTLLFQSFPSGHACTIGAICGAFSCIYPRFSPLFLLIGLIFAFSRIVLGVHFLSDIIAGLVLGLLISQSIYICMKKQGTQF